MASLLNMSGGSLLGKRLPYDAEIEWLEGDGKAYIDTHIELSHDLGFSFDVSIVSIITATNDIVFGCTDNGIYQGGKGVGFDVVEKYFYFGGLTSYTPQIYLNTFYHVSLNFKNNGLGVIDDYSTQLAGRGYSYTTKSITFFYWNGGRGGRNFSGGRYKFKQIVITQNKTIILNLIPVRIGTIGYMYDKVSGQLFGNSGTGDFILGPDKTN